MLLSKEQKFAAPVEASQVYIARQPILDRGQRTVAYELLYRTGKESRGFADIDGESATSRILINCLSHESASNIVGGKKAFVNFPPELLLDGIPDGLDPERVVIEVLENATGTYSMVEALTIFRNMGFTIALDDFDLNDNTESLLQVADIVKVDWLAQHEKIIGVTEALKEYNVELLAEKIETDAQFKKALDLGYSLFQGYFFARPQVVSLQDLPISTRSWLNIFRALQKPDLSFDELEAIISQDPALAYKLLKIINSAAFAIRNGITSVKQALIFLGEEEIRAWLSLIALAGLSTDKSEELVKTACLRGRFIELLMEKTGAPIDPKEGFFTGLMSLLDAMSGIPLHKLIQGLPLSTEIVDALIYVKGPIAPYLDMVIAYERAIHPKYQKYAATLDIELEKVVRCYFEAVQWTDEIFNQLMGD